MDRLFVPEFRAVIDEQARQITGHASVFRSLAPIGGKWEQIDTRAFDNALKRPDDVRFLLNHNPDNLLGRTTSGTLQLETTDKGLQIRSELPDTSLGRDVKELVKRGDLTGMSFGFLPTADEISKAPDGRQLRTITDLQLFDVSLATYPAYKDSNDVALRAVNFSNTGNRRSQLIGIRSRLLTKGK